MHANVSRRMKQSKQKQQQTTMFQFDARLAAGEIFRNDWKRVDCVRLVFVAFRCVRFVGHRCLREHFNSSVCCGITTESRGNSVLVAFSFYLRVYALQRSFMKKKKIFSLFCVINLYQWTERGSERISCARTIHWKCVKWKHFQCNKTVNLIKIYIYIISHLVATGKKIQIKINHMFR